MVERMCTVCREMKDKNALVRVARADGRYFVDKTGKAGGRGAYICKNPACINLARKKNVFARSFSGRVPCEIYDNLEEMLQSEE